MRTQRTVLYKQRQQIINTHETLKPVYMANINHSLTRLVQTTTQGDQKDTLLHALYAWITAKLADPELFKRSTLHGKSQEQLLGLLADMATNNFQTKNKQLGEHAQMLTFTKVVLLRVVHSAWTDQLHALDQLRQSIGLRGYGQILPLVTYQTTGYRMLQTNIASIQQHDTRLLLLATIRQNIRR